jgi:nicotinamide mononucleotide (NMN) deamidase PncC
MNSTASYIVESKELGLIYIAVCSAVGSDFRELMLRGDRDENKAATVIGALKLLLLVIKKR